MDETSDKADAVTKLVEHITGLGIDPVAQAELAINAAAPICAAVGPADDKGKATAYRRAMTETFHDLMLLASGEELRTDRGFAVAKLCHLTQLVVDSDLPSGVMALMSALVTLSVRAIHRFPKERHAQEADTLAKGFSIALLAAVERGLADGEVATVSHIHAVPDATTTAIKNPDVTLPDGSPLAHGLYLSSGTDPTGRAIAVLSDGHPKMGHDGITVLTTEVLSDLTEAEAWGDRMVVEQPWMRRQ